MSDVLFNWRRGNLVEAEAPSFRATCCFQENLNKKCTFIFVKSPPAVFEGEAERFGWFHSQQQVQWTSLLSPAWNLLTCLVFSSDQAVLSFRCTPRMLKTSPGILLKGDYIEQIILFLENLQPSWGSEKNATGCCLVVQCVWLLVSLRVRAGSTGMFLWDSVHKLEHLVVSLAFESKTYKN